MCFPAAFWKIAALSIITEVKTPLHRTANGDKKYLNIMKLKYNQPVAEFVSEELATAILDASVSGEMQSYGQSEDLTW